MPEREKQSPLVFNRVFVVYGKDSGLNENDFQEHFQQFGNIQQVHLSKEQATGKPKGIAYIRFKKTSEACLAVEGMNMTSIGGRNLKVHIAHDKKDSLEIDVDLDCMLQRLFIRHDKDATSTYLKNYFEQWGPVIWMYMIKDKTTGRSRGSAFIKYEHQSEAARALEECDSSYKPRWADVRPRDPDTPFRHGLPQQMKGREVSDEGYGGYDMDMYGMGGNMGMAGGMEMAGGGMGGSGMGGGMDTMEMGSGMGGDPMSMMNAGPGGQNKIEALVPSVMTKEQIYKLFDIVPGLQFCRVDPQTGMVKVQYKTEACASHAKVKIDGLELYGQNIAVRFAKSPGEGMTDTTAQIQSTLRSMQGGNVGKQQLQTLVQSLKKVTQAISGGSAMGGDEFGSGNFTDEMMPWSNVVLPMRKPILSPDIPMVAKVFILSMPGVELFPNELLINVCCRFGDLISTKWLPGKRYAFAEYASREAAEHCVKVLNGAVIMDNELKVELASDTKKDGKEGPTAAKRQRQW